METRDVGRLGDDLRTRAEVTAEAAAALEADAAAQLPAGTRLAATPISAVGESDATAVRVR